MKISAEIKTAFDLISQVMVHGDAVDVIAAARRHLAAAHALALETENTGAQEPETENSGAEDGKK